MTRDRDIERAIIELEGASSALWNFAQSGELTMEVAPGLQWIAQQMDLSIDELRQKWDAFNLEPPLKAVEG